MGSILGSVVGSAIGSLAGGSGSDSGVLAAQQAQFEANFKLETEQAMVDNQNQTDTAIMQSHAQAASAATAGAREVGEANAKIVA
jgi:hypothetical protein